MKWMDNLIDRWYAFVDKISPFLDGTAHVFGTIGRTISNLWKYLFWFRSVVLGAPLGVAACVQAARNANRLPEMVAYTKIALTPEAEDALLGLFTVSAEYISRDLAVIIPLGLTGFCIVMMVLSKRMLYPFVIGLLTVVLAEVLYWFTVFPV